MKDYKINKESFSDSFRKGVYEIVSQIPLGKVSTYGNIASLLGVPQCARMVGRALKEVPAGLPIPCHRVVNSVGRLVPGWDLQKELLLAEHVSFNSKGCVNLKIHLWVIND